MKQIHTVGKNVLFLSLAGIGNYLMQSPTIAALKQAHPNWKITVWVAPRGTRELVKSDPHVDDIIEMPIQCSLISHIRQAIKLRARHFDIGIVLSPGQRLKSAVYIFLADISRRVGAAYPFRKNIHSSFLLTHAIHEQENIHDIEQNLRLLEPLGISVPKNADTKYSVHIPAEHMQAAEVLVRQLAIPRNKTVIGIHAGSASDLAAKRWPSERFAEVATQLVENHNAHILLLGGPDEGELKQKLKDLIGRSATIINAPLLTVAAAMQHCQLVIGADTGLLHLATATDVPTVSIFGPTDERTTGPRGPRAHIIRAPGTKPVYDTEQNFYLGTAPHNTMKAVSTEMVLNVLRQYI